ncbi:hypothetical protein BJX66DRAFT_95663 [Aspergillus keveii]|uniref:Uncharacterized protein n=1 Tax=Aspergillus keveii TaxID=714993 RepID=A0ABR4FM67_9EURO
MLNVYPGSHHFETENELQASELAMAEIRIRADQVLVTYGGLWVEEASGGSSLMWMGVSKEIIGLHIDEYCLPFVALAHDAGQFLSRPRPPPIRAVMNANPPSFPAIRQLGPSGQRSDKADEFLEKVSMALPQISELIERLQDPTSLMMQHFNTADDPRVKFLALGHVPSLEKCFLRAIIVRYLTECCSLSGGIIKDFIQEASIEDTAPLRAALAAGQKIYWLEKALKLPGIWVAFMSVFSRIAHLPSREVHRIPELEHENRHIVQKASDWSGLMVDCSRLCRCLILGL